MAVDAHTSEVPSRRTAGSSWRARRRRRLTAALLSVFALVVSFLPLGSVAEAHLVTDGDANDVFDGTWPPNAWSGWNLSGTNPALVQECGIDVGILIDRSGSIAQAGQQQNMRDSAKAIVGSLAGTPSRVGVWSFGDDSSASGTAAHPAQQLTEVGGPTGPAGVASLEATIDSIPIVTNVATNYEAGFGAVHEASLAGSAPDLLFVLTDGNPTVHIDDTATGGTTNNDDVDGGIRTANLVKGDGTRIFGVGIGDNISTSVLGLIANPLAYDGSNFTTAGYTLTSFADLESTLRQLVTELCGGTVTVQKLADEGDGTFVEAQGWEFTLDPANAALPNQTETTDTDGQLNFDIDSFVTEQVTLTENLGAEPGYVFLADQLACTNSAADGAAVPLTPVVNGATFDVAPGDIISCTFKNKREFVDLGIAKTDGGASTVPGGEVTYDITYGNQGNVDAPGTVVTETVPADTTVDLGVGPADGRNDAWVCGGADSGVHGPGTVCTFAAGTVPAGASNLTVPGGFTVTVVDPAPFGLTEIANVATIAYDDSKGPDTDPTDNTASDTTPVVSDPQLTLDKLAMLDEPGADCAVDAVDELTIVAGDSVVYCYEVTNPGDAPAIDVSLVDDDGTPGDPGDDFVVTLVGLTDADGDGTADDLAPGAVARGTSPPRLFTVAGTVVNVAAASAQGEQATDDATVVVTRPGLTVVKTAVEAGDACPGIDGVTLEVVAGAEVGYCYSVTNPGDAALLDVVLSDDAGTPADPSDDVDVTLVGLTDADGDGTADDLAAGATATGATALEVFDTVGSVTNVAEASGESATGEDFAADDDATVVVTRPGLTVVKTAVEAGDACPGIDAVTLVVPEGTEVRYCYTVANPGSAPLLDVELWDDAGTPLDVGDDVEIALSGLTDTDGDGTADDLAAGATAEGASLATAFDPGTVINVATATGLSATQEPFDASDTAVVTTRDVAPTIEVTKTADPTAVPEPGGAVDFAVEVENTSAESVTVTSITDSVDGGAAFSVTSPATAPVLATDCEAGTVIAAGGTYSCTFTVEVSGNAGDVVADTVVATVVDDDGTEVSESADATVEVTDVAPTIEVTKTADPMAVPEPGGAVDFAVEVENTSAESVTVTSITDSVDGGAAFSVTSPATAPVSATDCEVGAVIAAGGTYSCTFTLEVVGTGGELVADTVVVTVVDDDGSSDTDDADETTPVTPVVDLSVDKSVDADELIVGQAATYTVVVTNGGPSDATGVVLTDSLPDGLTLVSIGEPEGWTCEAAQTIVCTTPGLAAGATATFTMTVFVGVEALPSVTNVVEVDSAEPDADPADNVDEVTTPVGTSLGLIERPSPVQVAGAVQSRGALPFTGSDVGRVLAAGVLFVLVGSALVVGVRRRRGQGLQG